jgi:hypothetical protein
MVVLGEYYEYMYLCCTQFSQFYELTSLGQFKRPDVSECDVRTPLRRKDQT